MFHSTKTLAVPPGATIREQLEERGMSQKEFALRMGLSEKHVSHLINGKVELTPDVSLRLENVLGMTARFWNNLEALYQEQIARAKSEIEDEKEQALVSRFPYAKLAKAGFVPKTGVKKEKIQNLRRFFEVAKLGIIDDLYIPGIAYRKGGTNRESDYNLAAWAQKAKVEARKIATGPINIGKLMGCIARFRECTREKPDVFGPEIQRILSDCGVALVFLPHIEGSYLNGASFLDGKKIILGLTVRGKDADRFWFSFFHELFHIIDGHINSFAGTSQAEEKAADEFSRDTLIPPKAYKEFVDASDFTKVRIVEFAENLKISPCIVLGRLQYDGKVSYNQFRDLKTQYDLDS
ncbi:ImmA/IrrE family metallo-endopeptidase [Lactovum odontotermitis]